ncbi:hypothetical protein [Kitasatospora azatica]|uniref:hypothetical protein n=1 Tax=Kitasatospora azatica TaxID=58347 RepID=UPI00055CC067|nr:hypothetical protein [Kitasatospora azatica]
MNTDSEGGEPAEHARFARYLDAFAQVPEAAEVELVTVVLGDPDQVMAVSAVAQHLDRRAAALLSDPRFQAWAASMSGTVASYPFLTRRLSEWSLFRAIAVDEPWDPDALITATDWLQRKVSEGSTSARALRALAESGRTRRVRSTARTRLTQRRR